MKKVFLLSTILLATTSCVSGSITRDVDFPATPVDMTKITKKGKACFKMTLGTTRGAGSVIEAARSVGIKTVYMVEYTTEFEAGGFVRKACTVVYGD